MRRDVFIELISREYHGGFAPDDTSITNNFINTYIEPAIGVAAQTCYDKNVAVEGVGYVNNSFYTTFKSLTITSDGNFLWKVTLPEIPQGLGQVDGISRFVIKDNTTPQTSFPVLLLSENQVSIQKGMRNIPNKLIGYPEGKYLYIQSTLILSSFTGQVTMISGGSSTELTSEINVPPNYLPVMQDWIMKQLMLLKAQPVDVTNDGESATNFQ